jgi:hypothetical protein
MSESYAHEVHAHEVYAREKHAHKVHTCEMHVYVRYTPIRCTYTPMRHLPVRCTPEKVWGIPISPTLQTVVWQLICRDLSCKIRVLAAAPLHPTRNHVYRLSREDSFTA